MRALYHCLLENVEETWSALTCQLLCYGCDLSRPLVVNRYRKKSGDRSPHSKIIRLGSSQALPSIPSQWEGKKRQVRAADD
jgi:hypothetical protein